MFEFILFEHSSQIAVGQISAAAVKFDIRLLSTVEESVFPVRMAKIFTSTIG